jgi:GNAT superfamily N-acetyltransferase
LVDTKGYLPPEQLAPDVDFRAAWKLDDAQLEADAIDFWSRTGILPRSATPEDRVKELLALAYKDGKAIAVMTAKVGRFDQVRARLAFTRGAVDPEYRRSHIGFVLFFFARDLLVRWGAEHPEERLAGLGSFIESRELAERARKPYGDPTGFGVVGFMPDGRQIRVSWFREFRLDLD